jgi:hypothetical protein
MMFIGARVSNNAAQDIPNNVPTTLSWDTELFDSDGFHESVTNPERITIPAGLSGKYLISAKIRWTTLGGYHYLKIIKGGTVTIAQKGLTPRGLYADASVVACISELVAGDYLTVVAHQIGSAESVFGIADGNLDDPQFMCCLLEEA